MFWHMDVKSSSSSCLEVRDFGQIIETFIIDTFSQGHSFEVVFYFYAVVVVVVVVLIVIYNEMINSIFSCSKKFS